MAKYRMDPNTEQNEKLQETDRTVQVCILRFHKNLKQERLLAF